LGPSAILSLCNARKGTDLSTSHSSRTFALLLHLLVISRGNRFSLQVLTDLDKN
jgi:hypothetical protein